MNIHLFIVKSGKVDPNLEKIANAFGEINTVVQHIENDYSIINDSQKYALWYCVLYDNEIIDKYLAEALPRFLELTEADALGVYRKIDSKRMSKSIRFFRRNVKINKERLLPQGDVKVDFMLNGWVTEYD